MEFEVTIQEESGRTQHRVTLDGATCRRLGRDRAPEQLIEASFRFLLDREPKESILSRFDLTLISHYFPEFEGVLPEYLK